MDIKDLILPDAVVDVIENGAWVGGFDDVPGVEIKVIGTTSRTFRKAINAKIEAARADNKGAPVSPELIADLVAEAMGEVAILDWRGITNDGEPVPFSRELAKQWMTAKGGKTFIDLVAACAHRLDTKAADYIEQATKN